MEAFGIKLKPTAYLALEESCPLKSLELKAYVEHDKERTGQIAALEDLVRRCGYGLETAPVTDEGWCDQRKMVLKQISAALTDNGGQG